MNQNFNFLKIHFTVKFRKKNLKKDPFLIPNQPASSMIFFEKRAYFCVKTVQKSRRFQVGTKTTVVFPNKLIEKRSN